MSEEQKQAQEQKLSRRAKAKLRSKEGKDSSAHKIRRINPHINFKREVKKSSARKRETEVTCCKCKKMFVAPFKPRRPDIYCNECFKERNKSQKRPKK